MTDRHDSDDLLHRLLAESAWAFEPEEPADVDALLDAADAEQLNDDEVERILHGTAALRCGAGTTLRPSDVSAPGASVNSHARNDVSPQKEVTMKTLPPDSANQQSRSAGTALVVVVCACVMLAVGLFIAAPGPEKRQTADQPQEPKAAESVALVADSADAFSGTSAGVRPEFQTTGSVEPGTTIQTGARERQRLTLADGSILYVNENASLVVETDRKIRVRAGEVFVEVAPQFDEDRQREKFVVETEKRQFTALGTKFSVTTEEQRENLFVAQGKVKVSDVSRPVTAGQRLTLDAGPHPEPVPAERASHALHWTKELMAAAEPSLVPASQYAGGAVVVVDPNGQEAKLSLRKFHVDVHVEDGFARTTIDQTFFNHTHSRQEGTFYFPLPPDASLSRLAMYVAGTLMEGGMVERNRGREVFEQIRHTRRDPALLEWVDGTTFKMRVFPLEARQEKRIVLSYTQKLPTAYGKTRYRFPAGHNMELVRDFSTRLRIHAAGRLKWYSPSHEFEAREDGKDLVLEHDAQRIAVDKDVVLELTPRKKQKRKLDPTQPRFSSAKHEQHQYLMPRVQPDLKGTGKRASRNWVILFEASADRNPLLARTQIDVVKTLLKNAEHDDTFTIVSAGTRPTTLETAWLDCSPTNIERAVAALEKVHLVGALHLEKALKKCRKLCRTKPGATLLHVGSAIPVLGERESKPLTKLISAETKYVGVAVGKRWSQQFMKAAASKTGGYTTQINPDEQVSWRAFEVASTLSAPRLLDIELTSNRKGVRFLTHQDSLAHGEEFSTVARIAQGEALPESVTLRGTINGEKYEQTFDVASVADEANYLPRIWARLEIDRLIDEGPEQNKPAIITLSKAMYVMSPFTSLLVLENEAMYAQFKVDRGRKDHWALYACSGKIPVVHEPVRWNRQIPWLAFNGYSNSAMTSTRPAPRVLVQPGAAGPKIYPVGDYVVNVDRQFWYAPSTNFGTLNVDGLTNTLGGRGFWGAVDENRDGVADGWSSRNRWGDYSVTVVDKSDPNSFWKFQEFVDSTERWDVRTARPEVGRFLEGSLEGLPAIQLGLPHLATAEDGTVTWNGVGRNVRVQNGPVRDFIQNGSNGQLLGMDVGQYELAYGDAPGDGELFFGGALQMPGYGDVSGFAPFVPAHIDHDFNIPSRDGNDVYTIRRLNVGPYSQMLGVNGRLSGIDVFEPQSNAHVGSILRQDIEARTFLNVMPLEGITAHRIHFAAADVESELMLRRLDGFQSSGGRGSFPNGIFGTSAVDGRVRYRRPVARTDGLGARGFDQSLRSLYQYAQPRFANDARLFTDLIAHAPGMNTSTADRWALFAQRLKVPKQGRVDAQARKLIDAARGFGWERIVFEGEDSQRRFVYDGTGRFVSEQNVSVGLRERVLCDGKSLWHLYDEIGVGARRDVSRFHRAGLYRALPWLVRSVEELAQGADVTHVDARTIAVVPLRADDDAEQATDKDDDKTKVIRPVLHLIFAKNGRLIERRLVDAADDNATLLRITWNDEGVRVLDKDDKRVSERTLQRVAAKAPSLVPRAKGLVVLPLPLKMNASAAKRLEANESDFSEWSAADALSLIAADLGSGAGARMQQVMLQRFINKGDQRIGFYTLLAASPAITFPERDMPAKLRDTPLGDYLRTIFNLKRGKNPLAEFIVDEGDATFLGQLATVRNLLQRWQNGQATKHRTNRQIQLEWRRVRDYLDSCPSPQLRWALVTEVRLALLAGARSQVSSGVVLWRLRERMSRFEQTPALAEAARYERMRMVFMMGDVKANRKALKAYYAQCREQGRFPRLDQLFYKNRLTIRDDYHTLWQSLVNETHKAYLEDKQYVAAMLLVLQMEWLGEIKTGNRLLDATLQSAGEKWSPALAILTARALRSTNHEFARLDKALKVVLKTPGYRFDPATWFLAAQSAGKQGEDELRMQRYERAVQLQLAMLPDAVNLQTIRQQFTTLMGYYEREAGNKTGKADVEALVQRVCWAADQWRKLDPDATAACQKAARILTNLDEERLAWDYLVSPVAKNPNAALPWWQMANWLRDASQTEKADEAYAAAYRNEPTNPQILWDEATMWTKRNELDKATTLYEQIAEGEWQPRFQNVKTMAEQKLKAGGRE